MRRTGKMAKNVPSSAHVQRWARGQPTRSSTERGVPKLVTYLLLLVPLSVVLAFGGAPSLWVFAVATAAIAPLAEWLRRATEQLTARAGSAVGGLLNVTLGNMTELILALFVLMAGKSSIVKATITGSMIGNSLLGLGLAILVGSWRRHIQTFKRERAGLLANLLILSAIALLLPALFHYTERSIIAIPNARAPDERLSLSVAVLLILAYLANLVHTLVTHRDIFATDEGSGHARWPLATTLAVLIGATSAIAVEAEFISGAIEAAAQTLGLSSFFLGLIVLPLIGNVTEYFTAVAFARDGQMDLVMSITVGSSIQIALMTAPALVLISYAIGRPMNLVFANPLELMAIVGVAFTVNAIAQDGQTTWFEGLLLLVVYLLLALAFFFLTT
jgi:Ca2+:H+ antiporter